MRGCHARASGGAPQLVDGRENLGRFGDDDEQGSRTDRGASSVRASIGTNRHIWSMPQSVIHSMVEFIDGSVLAQLGSADMRIPIAHTLAYPDRMATPASKLDLAKLGTLSFEAPDPARFPGAGPGSSRARKRRFRSDRPQCRQRDRGRQLPRPAHRVQRHYPAGRRSAGAQPRGRASKHRRRHRHRPLEPAQWPPKLSIRLPPDALPAAYLVDLPRLHLRDRAARLRP